MADEKRLTVDEVCDRLGITRPTFYAYMRRYPESFTTFKIGHQRFMTERQYHRFLQARQNEAA